MKRLTLLLLLVLTLVPMSLGAQDSPLKAKNVILMIGDGMGFNQHLIGSYWRHGTLGQNSYESFPFHCACTTFSAKDKNVQVPTHHPGYDPKVFWSGPAAMSSSGTLTRTTDSAAAATSLNAGVKTFNGALGVDSSGQPVELLVDVATAAGKSVGAVTTVPLTHATPAGVYAHSVSRNNFTEIMEQCGSLSVLMGAAHPCYNVNGKPLAEDKYDYNYIGGKEIWDEITSPQGYRGFTFIDRAEDFQRLAQGVIPPTDDRGALKVLGIARVQEAIPPIDGTPSDAKASPEVTAKVLGRYNTDEMPTLATMSLAALNVLAQNENGFYLMIEGGAIDFAGHGNDTPRLAFEHAGFSKAIDTVVQWVENNSSWDETVLIVTADHETGFVWGKGTYIDQNEDGKFKSEDDRFVDYRPIVNEGGGILPEVQFLSTDHTNSLVPVWGIGVGIAELEKCVYGIDEEAAKRWNFSGKYIDNTDIGFFLKSKM
ncbi:MAG: alkaline phosphatase [Planctomycetaceae bacterium]|nr:alkaline phosphatase [Planctomycetaceae bacterium]